ncbi:MAG: hypothetical protein AB1611_09990 [bacterium]
MNRFPKTYILTFLLLFMAGFSPAQTLAAPASDQVVFSFEKENVTSPGGQIHRVHFGIQKGSAVVPVCLTTSIEYDTEVFDLFSEEDLVASSNVSNKAVTPNLSKNDQGIIKVGVGVEDYNDTPLPEGEMFYINFRVKPGVTPEEDDVAFNYNIMLGPNQASDSSARLLKVADVTGAIFNDKIEVANTTPPPKKSGGGSKGSCFIGSLIGWHK